MSQKANPTVVGLFIVIGVALGVGALILFSSGRLFSRHQQFILYFNASLKGLSQGAPVKFRGVTIGSVSQVLIRHNQAPQDYYMPVIIDIDATLAQSKSDREIAIGNKGRLEELIKEGFRGRLDTESLLTGVLYVELEPVPHAPPPVFHQLTPEYPEIPTVPTEIQRFLANLAQLDLRGLTEKLERLLGHVETALGQLNLAAISSGMTNLLGTAQHVLSTPDLTNSLVALRQTLGNAQGLLKRVDGRVDPLVDSATNTLAAAQKTLAELRLAVENFNGVLEPDAPVRTELTAALAQLNNAARAIAELAEFLERNPNALLTGRKLPKESP